MTFMEAPATDFMTFMEVDGHPFAGDFSPAASFLTLECVFFDGLPFTGNAFIVSFASKIKSVREQHARKAHLII